MTRSEELMALEISLLLDMGRRYGQLVKKRTGSGASRSRLSKRYAASDSSTASSVWNSGSGSRDVRTSRPRYSSSSRRQA